MSTQVGQVYPIISDKSGAPLDNGLIYIGEAGQNAEIYPIQIYYDEDFTIPAPQPLRTINGYFSRNGSPAKIFINAVECSIIVKDKFKILQWLDLNYTGILSGAGIKASDVLDESGKTQQEINDSIAVKLLTAVDAGLVIWPEMKQPSYSQKDYDDAFNNSINLVRTLERLNNEGYSKVVMQRFDGVLPTCYSNLSGSSLIRILDNSCHAILTGTSNLEVDGNGNTIAVMFDSNNKSPYDNSTLQPYELRGAVIGLQHNTNLNIHSFELVGDQYTRSWVSGEQNTEQTYGFYMGINNINTKIDIVGRGFRGDAISGTPRGTNLYALDNNWSLGGVDLTTGAEIVEAGSYRSPRIDLQGKTIYRNAVQIYTTGYLRAAEFRNDLLGVFFYDANGNFISTEKTRQCDFIFLPVGCGYIQFVAYEDERTDPTVGYGVYIQLVTGSSDIAEIKGEYYANHRGAISNLCGNTTVDAFIHDNGTTKYGFPHYADPTRYGVNFEDTYVSKLTVRGKIQNGISAILCNAKTLNVSADIRNMQFAALGVYSTFEVNAIGLNIDNVWQVLEARKTPARIKNRLINLSNSTIKNSRIHDDYSDNPDILLNIKGNTWANSSAQLSGNGSNIVFDDNTFTSVGRRYISVMDVRGALSAKGNSIIRSNNVPTDSKGWGYISLSARNAGLNLLQIDQPAQRLLQPTISGDHPKLIGTNLLMSTPVELFHVIKSGGFVDHIDKRNFERCVLSGSIILVTAGVLTSRQCDMQLLFEDVEIKNKCTVRIQRDESEAGSVNTMTFKNSLIDLTTVNFLIDITKIQSGTWSIKFINCTFISDITKSIPLVRGQLTNITSQAIGCRFINVTNTDGITVVS